MWLAFKAGLRQGLRGKLETIALVAVILLAVGLYGVFVVSADNMSRHVYLQMRDRMGDIMVAGVLTADHRAIVEEVGGVESVELARVIPFAVVETPDGEQYSVAVAESRYFERLSVKDVDGRLPSSSGEAILYWTLGGGGLAGLDLEKLRGRELLLRLYSIDGEPVEIRLRVVGTARGFEWIGGRPMAVVVSGADINMVVNGFYTMMAVRVSNPESVNLDDLADEISRRLEASGAIVSFTWVNKPEENPVKALLEGAMSVFTTPASLLFMLIPLLPAAAGSAMVVRDSRMIAVMRAMGGGLPEIALYYAAPWLLRGFLGVALGLSAVYTLSEPLYTRLFVGDSEIAKVLYSAYGFEVKPGLLAMLALASVGGVAAGVLVPLLIALRVDVVRAIQSSSLPLLITPPRIRLPGPLVLVESLRDIVSRPFKLAALALALGILAGIPVATSALSNSLDDVKNLYSNVMPPDAFVAVQSLALGTPPKPAAQAMADILENLGGVEGYTVFDSRDYVNALGLKEFTQLVAVVYGDPGVAFPLLEGRYPEKRGEVVISAAFSELRRVGVGESIRVDLDGTGVEMMVVGVSKARLNNGFYLVVTPGYFREITGTPPGVYSATAHVDLAEGVDPEEFLGRVENAVSSTGFLTVVVKATRSDIVNAIGEVSTLYKAIMGGVGLLAAVGVAITIASIFAIDVSSRAREIAGLIAIGTRFRRIAASTTLQILLSIVVSLPIAYASGYMAARVIAERAALAVGYLPPRIEAGDILSSGTVELPLVIGAASALASISLFLRRLRIVEILRE
ncbi:ABC-type antimicrobial peptide transporter permease [Aeropyrum pernix]|uniref:ABC-type antimicrobial peptide transporter permease n=1 Tax=Aeropyrum pernix TaxID=56636 RepID=A0A401H9G6_AERPX|nr:ABC transporter permease [Aeropyrum pernix]GBF09057.1 ABC-type antimicrobial peptide transporter permease [Aeropyrum pernix]